VATHGGGPRWLFPRPREIAELALSTLAIGAVLVALPPTAEPPLGHQVVAAGALLVVWCYCDGIVGRLHLGLAALEGLLRLKLALHWTMLLLDVCGGGRTADLPA
jgi:hypothetical protein